MFELLLIINALVNFILFIYLTSNEYLDRKIERIIKETSEDDKEKEDKK
jgi:hypothetical protein